MKRIIAFFLAFLMPLMLLSSCTSNNDTSSLISETSTKKETIKLTTSNYQNYIVVYLRQFPRTHLGNNIDYYGLEFQGSSLCKFNNVTITYSLSGYSGSCTLNLSGCGQGKFMHFDTVPTKFDITAITGTVEILY